MSKMDAKNALQQKVNSTGVTKPNPNKGMKQLLTKMAAEIESALPNMVSSERFQRVALTAFSSNPKLQGCEPMSFVAAMMQSAQLGLEPNTVLGQSYLIPYKVKGVPKVKFEIGYKGLLELAHRTGRVKTIYAHEVKENDTFDIDYGTSRNLTHKPFIKGDRGESIGYYALYELDNGGQSFLFMSKDEVLKHAKRHSKTYESGPWQTDFDAMAKKTVVKQLLKFAPTSVEMQKVVAIDESVKSRIDKDMDLVDNEIDYIETEDYSVKEVSEAEPVM
jgi:recombination protein RecT